MMLYQQLVPLEERETWGRIVEGLPHGINHTHNYNRALAYSTQGQILLYHAWDNEGFETICPLRLKDRTITTPYGLSGFSTIGHCSLFVEEWSEFCQKEGWVAAHITQHPSYESPLSETGHLGTPAFFCNPQEIHPEDFEGHAQKSPVTIIKDDSNLLNSMPRFLCQSADEMVHFTQQTLSSLASMDGNLCLSVVQDELVLGVALFLSRESEAELFFMALCVDNCFHEQLLIKEGLARLKAMGISSLRLPSGKIISNSILKNSSLEIVSKMTHTIIFDEIAYRSDHQVSFPRSYPRSIRGR